MRLGTDYLRDAKIVVIGAGVVGSAVSYRLAQAGAQVTTIERRYPGCGTTNNSFAWLNGFDKHPKHYHRLNVQSVRDHEDLADEVGGRWVQVDGGIHWEHAADEERVKVLRSRIKQYRDWGVRVDPASPEIVMREVEPDLWIDPEKVSEVYVVPREGILQPVAMAHGVMHAAETRYGATLVKGNVVSIRVSKGAVSSVVLEDGREFPADVVVNATGQDANRIAAMVGVQIPMDTTLGFTLVTPPAPVCLKHLVHSPEATFRPEGAGRLIIRNRDIDGHLVDRTPLSKDSPLIREVMDRARQVIPSLAEIEPDVIKTGVRPMPKDGRSIVGFHPDVAGFYLVVTHSGITLSARLALLVTEELSGGDTAELEPYRVTRFGGTAGGASI